MYIFASEKEDAHRRAQPRQPNPVMHHVSFADIRPHCD